MNKKTLKTLEYFKILGEISNFAINEETKEIINHLEPSVNSIEINNLLDQLDEAVSIVLHHGNPPINKSEDILGYVNRAKIDAVLNTAELLSISSLLRSIKDIKSYLSQDETVQNTKFLKEYLENLNPLTNLEKEITRIILAPNVIADNASRKLSELRKQIKEKEKRISVFLENLINSSKYEKYLQERIITIRNGRYAVPVKSEYRSKVPGAVLDRSSTGATVFIEPLSVLELNNDINELEVQERKEIERILKDLSEQVAFNGEEIKEDYQQLIELDFLFAKALYALAINGNRVQISNDNSIVLKQAKHPLIPKDKVVPSDLVINSDINTLVITGPNTGGKTVTLKTLGLLSLMLQSGLYLPVRMGSKSRIFENIFADIGDEQSIEQNLSTFSSHMTNIVEILDKADSQSLVLFDELGAGTDPVEGAALAISILEDLKQRQNLTVATTHYAEIKQYGLTEANTLNASMEFDINSLKPTYKLLIGLPGKSNAFEIAKRLGISKNIIENSKTKIKTGHKNLEDTLAKAQEELIKARDLRQEAEQLRNQSNTDYEKIQKEKETLNQQKKKIIDKANKEALEILNTTKKETDQIYKDIQKIQNNIHHEIDNRQLEALRKELNSKEDRLRAKQFSKYDMNKKYTIEDFSEGDRVYIKSLDREADIIKVNKKEKKVEISSGVMRIKLKPSDLVLVQTYQKKKPKGKITYTKTTTNQNAPKGKMSTRLDLRGKTAEEARTLVDDFINEALLLGQTNLEIIHGFGTGKVRQAVHDYLRKSNLVSSYRLGGPGEGGAGATIVTL